MRSGRVNVKTSAEYTVLEVSRRSLGRRSSMPLKSPEATADHIDWNGWTQTIDSAVQSTPRTALMPQKREEMSGTVRGRPRSGENPRRMRGSRSSGANE